MGYTLVFPSAREVNALVTEIFIGGYSDLPCVFLVKDDVWDLYFPDEIFPKLGEEGYQRFIAPSFLEDYKRKSAEIIRKYNELYDRNAEIAKADRVKFLDFFNEYVKLSSEFFSIYRLTEFFYFSKAEAALVNWAKKAHPDKYNEVVSEILAGKDFLDIPEELKQIIHVTRDVQHFRFELREVLNKGFFGDSLITKLMKRFEQITGRKDFRLLRADEIRAILQGKEVPPAGERMKFLAVYNEGGKWCFVSGDKARDFAEKIKPCTEGVTELKGFIASPGKHKGIVRCFLIGVAHDFSNMKKGDVLVSSTTGPEFMAAIQKAGAIVTDEGGLMSHAAVVSRELKIPCIVGTKLATKIFKDGNMVEVDADNGIVRKL